MSWMSELSQLYDWETDIIGEEIDGVTLLPIYHSTQKAQIDVFLFSDSTFAYARKVEEDDSITIIPVTSDSATRSNGIAAHPLCDKLIYVAGDYGSYVKGAKKNAAEFFEQYISQLSDWVNSEQTDLLIQTVYEYLRKGTLIEDLIHCGVLTKADNGFLDENIKIAATKQSDCFVRFTVIDKETADEQKVWKCRRLYDKFIDYTESVSAQRDLCYVTGEMLPVTYKHSSKIRNAGDKAKLLSSNDKDNYTYRGRFSTPAEAYAVSSIVSQKAHLALRWLIERQGTTVDTAKYVVWESHLQPILDAANPFGDNGFFDDLEDDALLPKTNIEYGKAVAKYIKGYRQKLDFSSKIMLICVDAATPGRLSMVQYQEFSATDYYDNLEKWYKGVSWLARWSRNGKHCCGIITPSPYQIARFACGTERSDSGKVVADNNQLKILFRQIYSCTLQGTAVPENILGSLYNRCAYPLKYSEKYGNWERLLEITCAVYRKHYIEKNGVTINVGLDRNCTDRSYLYGRLTAVADKMESDTFEGDARQTNAKRYMSAMLNAPFKTWAYLEERVLPYTAKIIKQTPQFYARYEKELGEIHSLFKMEDFASNERLDAKFFMGFYCQKQDFYKKATKETEE